MALPFLLKSLKGCKVFLLRSEALPCILLSSSLKQILAGVHPPAGRRRASFVCGCRQALPPSASVAFHTRLTGIDFVGAVLEGALR